MKYSLSDLESSLMQADAAGDVEAATALADAIRSHPDYGFSPPPIQDTKSGVDLMSERLNKDKGSTVGKSLRGGAKLIADVGGEIAKDASSMLEDTLSFFGIQTGEALAERERQIEEKLKSEGASPARIEATKLLLPTAESALSAGMFAVGGPAVSFLKGTAAIAGLNSVKSLMSSLATEEEEGALKKAVDVGVTSAAFDTAFRGAGIAAKGLGLTGLPEKGKKIVQSSRIIDNLKKKIGDVSSSLKGSVLALNKQIEDLEGKKILSNEPLKNIVQDTKPFLDKISQLDTAIDSSVREMIDPLSQGVSKVKRKLGDRYDDILKKETGDIPIDISDEIGNIGDALGIKSTKGRPTLKRIFEVLEPFKSSPRKGAVSKGPLKGRVAIKDGGVAESIPATYNPEGLELRDVHWIKQALNEYSRVLRNSPPSQELSFKLSSIADLLDDKIDSIAPDYKSVNSAYRQFKKVSEDLDRYVGKINQSVEFGAVRSGVGKISSEIRKAILSGKGIDDKLIESQSQAIRATNAKIKLLADNGFIDDANIIKRNMDKLVDENLKRIKVKEDLMQVKRLSKEPTQDFLRFQNEMTSIEKDLALKRLEKRKLQTRALSRAAELKKRGGKAEKVFSDLEIKNDALEMEVMALGDAISGAASAVPGARAISNLAKIIASYKTIVPKSAYSAEKALNKLDDYAKKVSAPLRGPLAAYIGRVKEIVATPTDDEEIE